MSESTFLFGAPTPLVGTFSRPEAHVAPAATGVLLLNAGVISRVGPHRMNVTLARALAALGYPCLRFDLSGLGDSPRSASSLPYEQQAIVDIQSAMDRLQALSGVQRFVLIGFCSGADNGYTTALRDPRLAGLVMFDPYAYPTPLTHLLRIVARLHDAGIVHTARAWLTRLWRRTTAPRPAANPDHDDAPANAASSRIVPAKAAFAQGMSQLLARGCQLYLIYSGSFLYTYNHRRQFAMNFWAWPALKAVRCDYLPEVDHVIGECRAQALLQQRLVQWVKQAFPAPHEWTPGSEN